MRRYRPLAVLSLVVLVLLSVAGNLSASTICDTSLPFNIDAGTLEPIALALLQRSPTFQQQCLRIAATVALRVRVSLTSTLGGGVRGQTLISRYETGALRADVQVRFGVDYFELLAHEFEHVLEQVDQISLADEASAKRAWTNDSGAYETLRASQVGLRARQEFDALAAESIELSRRPPPRLPDPFE